MGGPLPTPLLFFGPEVAAPTLTAPDRETGTNAVRAAQNPGP